jgi:hypothetical protein
MNEKNHLHKLLEFAESLEMSNGDYLLLANALKKIFNKKETVWTTYHVNDISLSCYNTNTKNPVVFELIEMSRNNINNRSPSFNKLKFKIKRNDEETIIIDEDEDVILPLIEALNPTKISINYSGFKTDLNYKKFKKMYKKLNIDDEDYIYDLNDFIDEAFRSFKKICLSLFWKQHRINQIEG